MSFLSPPDDEDVVYEFYHPFAHVPGKYELCRLLTATHGTFNAFILLGESTAAPATVYVDSDEGEAFMAARYPESKTHRVGHKGLQITATQDERAVEGALKAETGPVRRARMRITARDYAVPRVASYGGEGRPVWGSARYTCWGVDLELDALAHGEVEWAEDELDVLSGMPAIVTLGSFGRISPLRGDADSPRSP